MWQRILALFSILLSSSMYTINKYVDKIPPCRTPLETLKKYDVVEPHLIECLGSVPVQQDTDKYNSHTSIKQFSKKRPVIDSVKCF